jgi:hypothetical protein
MRPSTPILALTASLPLLTTAQLGADETICSFLYGTAYTDACCHSVISRGASAPCTDIEYVGNLTLCSTRHYPTGWAVCVEKVTFEDSIYISKEGKRVRGDGRWEMGFGYKMVLKY